MKKGKSARKKNMEVATACGPQVSVIMGVYNERDTEVLCRSIQSILDQTLTDFEFIIWDDGSDPELGQTLRSLEELDERIRMAGKDENRGLAFSLNECIKLARGKYIARMDADDISTPDRLQRQVSFLNEHPEYAWCGCGAYLLGATGVWGERMMPEVPCETDFLKFSPFIHPTVVFRKEVFGRNNRYSESDETLRCEDYEIFMRLYRKGFRGYNLPEKLFYYREERSSYQKRKARFRIDEAKLRYRNYREMGLLWPLGWIYVLRPLAAILIPGFVISGIKHLQYGTHRSSTALQRWKDETLYAYPALGTGTVRRAAGQ